MDVNKIREQIEQSDNKYRSKKPFLAVSVSYTRNENMIHAGLLIQCPDGCFFFDYNSATIGLEEVTSDTIEKHKFNAITFLPGASDEMVINSYLARFQLIKDKHESNIRYGYFFPVARFNADGTYTLDELEAPLVCTCVGFSLLVLNGLMKPDEKYLDPKKWTGETTTRDQHSETCEILENPCGDVPSDLLKYVKRILPIEFFAASFINKPPRTRKKIMECRDSVDNHYFPPQTL